MQEQSNNAAAVAIPDKKNKKPLIIAIAAIAVFAIALIAIFFVNSNSCYVATSQTVSRADGSLLGSTTREVTENGTVISVTSTSTSFDGKETTETTDYKEVINGMAIPEDFTVTYQIDSDGYVTTAEQYDADGKWYSSIAYTYYGPGIIRTSVNETKTATITRTYDEDGWVTSAITKSKDSSSDSSSDSEVFYDYAISNDGKTKTQYSFGDANHTDEKGVCVFQLNEQGHVVSWTGNSGISSVATLKKINNPAKMVYALSRLQG